MENIRRFGLKYCDISTMLWNVAVMLRVLLLNIDSSYKKKPRLWYYVVTFLCITCYFYVYFICIIYYVGWKYKYTQDTLTAVILLSLAVSSEIGTTKYIYIYFTRKTLVALINDFRAFDATVPRNSRMESNILSRLKHVKKRAMIFWIVIMANGVIYILIPIVRPGRHFPEDRHILLGLEPMEESPNYEIAFFTTIFGVIHTCFAPANVTALFIVLVGYIEAQMAALKEEMLCLRSDLEEYLHKVKPNIRFNPISFSNEVRMTVNKFVDNRLKEIINRHGTLVLLYMRLEKQFRYLIAVEFMLLMIALICELLGGLENTFIEMPYAFMQVFMDCLTGQRLMEASVAFADAIYFCNWEIFDVSNKKKVAIMLLCSQKFLILSAGGVTMLNFTSLMSVIRTVYSAYATLRGAV